MATKKTNLYRLLSLLAGRDALEELAARRQQEKSWRTISNEFRDEYDVDVTEATLRYWWAEHEREAAAAAG